MKTKATVYMLNDYAHLVVLSDDLSVHNAAVASCKEMVKRRYGGRWSWKGETELPSSEKSIQRIIYIHAREVEVFQ